MICQSPEMEKLHHILSNVAKGSHPVLIMGERGVGKELVARTIHANGLHADRPFVSVDCRSLASTSLASELFGLVKLPSLGTDRSKKRFPASSTGGTVFLDNIGGLSMDQQAKLFLRLEGKGL
jgi:DNA-binding NtrC family response regulator